MKSGTASRLVKSIRNKFGLTMFRTKSGEEQSEVMDYIYDQISHIPDEAAPWILDNFTSSYQKYPAVLDDAIKERFNAWLAKHPGKRTRRSEFYCNDCSGTGLLHVRPKDDTHTVFCFQCICGQFGSNSMPTRSKSSLVNNGYVMDSFELAMEMMVEPKTISRSSIFDEPSDFDAVMEELKEMKRRKEEENQCPIF